MTVVVTLVALIATLFGLYHFFALSIFNALVPKDAGSRRIARNVAFGHDPRLKLDIYAPRHGSGPWPVMIFVHGGGWSNGSKDQYAFVGRALAARGFLTLVPNYRLHPGVHFPTFVADSARAIDWASRNAARYGGDQKRIIVSGHSAGAYNAALAILDKRYLAELGTDSTVILGVVLLAAPLDFLPLDSPISIKVFKNVADLSQTQPITFARGDAPPFLLLHGAEDTTCLPKNSLNFQAKISKVGGRAEVKLYPKVGHVGILMATSTPLRGICPTLDDVAGFGVAGALPNC